MNKAIKIYLFLLAVVIAFLAFLQLNKSTIIDWRKTFDVEEKSPFGLYIFNQEVDELLGGNLERQALSPYEFYKNDSLISSTHNILLINYYVTEEGWDKIFDQVNRGANLMYIADGGNTYLNDTLNLSFDNNYNDSDLLELLDEHYKGDSIYINRVPGAYGIEAIDTLTTKILGVRLKEIYDRDSIKTANFVSVKVGAGTVYVHTEPMFLTNYYLLNKNDYRYAEDVFSYLPPRKTIWFMESNKIESSSPLRFILQTPAMRYAWYTMLAGVILFIIFNAKRRQRIVPVIEPNKNMSADFVKTIGNLYLQEGNYKDMAHKKATYFLNKARTDLFIDTHALDEVFWRRVKLKTGASEKDIQEVIPLIEKALHPQAPVQESELIRLNELLNKIYY